MIAAAAANDFGISIMRLIDDASNWRTVGPVLKDGQ